MARQRNLFNPKSKEPFKLSRTKLELFHECPRCFYLDRRRGVGRPSMPGFTLNNAVDKLLKKEFDIHRAKGTPHPLMKEYGIDAVPFAHGQMDTWRENFVGVQFLHAPTNFLIFGAVDDIWKNNADELHIVDYKATSTTAEITLDSEYRQAYKRQMEIYQWLLRRNGFTVSDTGYFVYVNGKSDRMAFDARLEFGVQIIPYKGNDGWIERHIAAAHACLLGETVPASGAACEHCSYVDGVSKALNE